MSKRFFRAICLVALAVFISVLVLILGLMYSYISDLLGTQLRTETDLAAHGVEADGIHYLASLNRSDYRITWISADGYVLYDSKSDTAGMENHMEREEVRSAMANGVGESSRYSTTMTSRFLYRAQRLEDGSVVRLAVSHDTTLALFLTLLYPVIAVAVLALILSFLLARRISARIIDPLNNLDLNALREDTDYHELSPLIRKIIAQQAQLHNDQFELEKTEQIRREFTANVSHELKTPLHTISGYAELIKDGLVKEEDIQPFAGKIYSETYRMTQLVEDIIELTRLDEGAEIGEMTRCDLCSIARNAVDSLLPFAKECGVKLVLEGDSCPMTAVPHLIYGIVYNLCDNAIKYNRLGGLVTVSVSACPECRVLCVEDNGIGIPPEHQNRIFERFYRVDKSHSKAVGGTGLGLSIVKHSAQIHGAEIRVESIQDMGTRVTVSFPQKLEF